MPFKSLRRFDYASALLFHFQRLVSHPFFFFFGFLGCILWIIVEAITPSPFDPPHSFYPFLILVVTLLGYWIESAMKVTQAKQSEQAQAQLDRLEQMAKDSNRRDVIMAQVLSSIEDMVDILLSQLDGKEDANEPYGLRGSDGKAAVNNPEAIASAE